jgi:CHAP domain
MRRGIRRFASLAAALAAMLGLAACGTGPHLAQGGAAQGSVLECAPYARAVSGVRLFGEADAWWNEAAGVYARGPRPVPGAVLVFRRSGRLPFGHVSVVTRILSGRSILVSQANWVHRRVTRDEPVVDVSPGNDWTAVRVWWQPGGQLGSHVYPTYGFIVPVRSRVAFGRD